MLIFPSCPTELLHTQLCPPAPKPTEAFGVSKAGDGRKDQDLAEVIKNTASCSTLALRSEVKTSKRCEKGPPWARESSARQKSAAVSYEWVQGLHSPQRKAIDVRAGMKKIQLQIR